MPIVEAHFQVGEILRNRTPISPVLLVEKHEAVSQVWKEFDLWLPRTQNCAMSTLIPSNPISRIRQFIRRHGLRATIGMIVEHIRMKLYLDDNHVWYELSLGVERPRMKLLSGLELIRAGLSELPLLQDLPSVGQIEARQRLESGADLWLVLKDRRPVFACWVYHDTVPVPAAPKGRLNLTPKIAFFEDSVTSQDVRGRGVPFAAWPRIADYLEQSGVESIATKVDADNVVARRAFTKAGFREIAATRYRRVGLRQYTTVRAGAGTTADWLVEQITPSKPGSEAE